MIFTGFAKKWAFSVYTLIQYPTDYTQTNGGFTTSVEAEQATQSQVPLGTATMTVPQAVAMMQKVAQTHGYQPPVQESVGNHIRIHTDSASSNGVLFVSYILDSVP